MSRRSFGVLLARSASPRNYLPVCRRKNIHPLVMPLLYRYGYFVPFNRLANIQKSYGVALSSSVQWQRAEEAANCLLPVFLYLQLRQRRDSLSGRYQVQDIAATTANIR
jgi:hypothetical protein